MKFLTIFFIVVLFIFNSLTAKSAHSALSRDLIWEFNHFSDPNAQGWYFENFDEVKIYPKKGIAHLELKDANNKNKPRMRQPSYYKSFVKANKFEAVEITMKVKVVSLAIPEDIKMHLEWSRDGIRKIGHIDLPLECDNKFHTYTFKVMDSQKWKGDFLRVALNLILPEKKISMECDIDRIRFIPSRRALFDEQSKIADFRIQALESLIKGLAKRGIKTSKKDELRNIREDFDNIVKTGKTEPGKAIAMMLSLEKKFSSLHTHIGRARKLAELYESSSAISDTVAFRKKYGKNITVNQKNTIKHLQNELKSLSQKLVLKGFSKYNKELDNIKKGQSNLWNKLLRDKGINAWQAGISSSSFGRYGWGGRTTGLAFSSNGKNFISRSGYFICANGHSQMFKFSLVNARCISKKRIKDLSWVSNDWEYDYRNSSGEKISWAFKNSMLAPGILLDTNAKAIKFSINVGNNFSPTAILAPTVNGPQILPFSRKNFNIAMSENWLLLLCSNGYPDAPYLLTFQKKPESFEWTKDSIIIKHSKGMGIVGIANPWGIRPFPINFSKNWKQASPDVVKQCRRIAQIMTCYPYKCDEYFKVNKNKGTISVANVIQYYKIKNEWNITGQEVAPVPPLLAFAVDNGYPAVLPEKIVDYNMPTLYGRYLAQNGNMVKYTLPIPDLRNPTPLKTDKFPRWQKDTNKFIEEFYPIKFEFVDASRLPIIGQNWVFPAWSILNHESRKILTENCRVSILDFFNTIDKLDSFKGDNNSRTMERTEPFSGLSYLVYGWNTIRYKQRIWGDVTNFSGMQLHLLYLYAKYTGDWSFIRNNWDIILRIFSVCPRRCDWAAMAQSCMEDYFLHTIDMGPDSWCAPVAMTKLADAIGDKRTRDISLYMATKQAVTLTTAFWKRKWDTRYNSRWKRKEHEQMPEVGWNDNGYVGGRWTKAMFDYNFINGIIYSPECLALYRDYCPEAAADFEYNLLEKYYPQWRNPRYLKYGKNSPGPLVRNLLLREALGESTNKLVDIFRGGLLEGPNDKSCKSFKQLGKYLSIGGLAWIKCAALSAIIGRDAPCQLADWSPAALVKASFKQNSGMAFLEFQSPVPFEVNLISTTKPESIKLNGQILSKDEWSFNASKKNIHIKIKIKGKISLILNYSGWKKSQRKPILIKKTKSLITKEELICRNERQRAESITLGKEDYQLGDAETIDLQKYFNANLNKVLNAKINISNGTRIFRGVPFTVSPQKNNIIRLLKGSKNKISLPINKVLKKIYFLHSSQEQKTGVKVIKYKIKYADGSSEVFPAVTGKNIGSWKNPVECPGAKLALFKSAGTNIGFYVAAWINSQYEKIAVQNADIQQRPLKKVASLEIELTKKSNSAVILAISIEK